jgi:hypothetical protein
MFQSQFSNVIKKMVTKGVTTKGVYYSKWKEAKNFLEQKKGVEDKQTTSSLNCENVYVFYLCWPVIVYFSSLVR